MMKGNALRLLAALCAASFVSLGRAYDYNGTPAGHLIYAHTTATIKQYIADGWRPTSISIESSLGGVGIYRVEYVRNTGTHYREARFEGEISGATLNAIRSAGWRIEDIEVVASDKYGCIFNKNDVSPRNTLWFAGWTATSVDNWLKANTSWRPLELDRYGDLGSERFSGVFIKNTGNGFVSGWGWYPSATSTTIANWSSANNMRLVDLDRGANGYYAAVMVARKPGERYYWFTGRSMSSVLEQLGGLGLRAVTINVRVLNGVKTFATTAVNNTFSQSARMADMCWPLHNGVQGFFVRQLGNTSPIVDLNGSRAMHPSSTIKALIHYTGVLDTATSSLNTRVIDGQSMLSLHQLMMYNSDNDAANTLMDAYTVTRLEQVAHTSLGMSNTTQMRNRFGTGGPYGNTSITETTLSDLAILHAAIRDGRLGTTKTAWMRNNMNNETRSFPWNGVVANVRTSLGISTTNYNDWASRVRSLNKAGNNSDSNGVNGYWSVAGSLTLPYKGATSTVNRTYLFGHYVNRTTISYDGNDPWIITGELLREQIRASMLTFV